MHGKRFARRFALFVQAVVITSCFAVSQPTPTPTPTNTQAQIWNLKNADIRAVIQTVSALTGKNFIVDPRVHGNITLISQKPITPDELYQVFLSMLQLLQYAAIPNGNVIKIVPAMDANALSHQIATHTNPGSGDEIVVRVVPVKHVSATELVPVLRPLMSQSGSVSAYLPSNALILAGTAGNIKRLMTIVRQMDSENASQIAVVHLHYANAKKITSVIHELQSGSASQGMTNNATLAADEDDNSILINANAANQLLMRNLIQKLDQHGSGGDDTRVVTLNYLSAKKVAPILAKIAEGISADTVNTGKTTTPATTSSDSKEVSVQAEENNNAIIMHAPKAMLNSLARVIRRLDVRPREVLVEAIIVKVDENVLDKLGIIWGTKNGQSTSGTSAVVPASTVTTDNSFVLQLRKHYIGLLPDGNLLSLLRVLKQNGATNVLSTPSVAVLDNQKATISDGQNVGVATGSYPVSSVTGSSTSAQNAVSTFQQVTRQDVGLSLDVKPHISPNNMIRMALTQKDDTIVQNANSLSDNPTFNTSKIKTSVLVKSGDILVLGGLMSNEQDKSKQKLPILGDLPIIGHLFSYDSNKMEKTSLMIFIRPVILSGQAALEQTLDRYSYVRKQQMETMRGRRVRMEPLPAPFAVTQTIPAPKQTHARS